MKSTGLIITGLVVVAVCFFLSLLILKVAWGWVIPDLFPGAVEQGLIVPELSWWVAIKLAIFVSALASAASIKKSGD